MIHLTHTDLDGIGNIIVNRYFDLRYDRECIVNYEDIETEDGQILLSKYFLGYKKTDGVIITDLSISLKVYRYLVNKFENVFIFDHHEKTAAIAKYKNVFFDTKRSGTKIYFDWISKKKRVPKILNDFIDLVDVYDIWKLEDPLREQAEDLNRVFYRVLTYGFDDIKKYNKFIAQQIKKIKDKNNSSFFFDDYEKDKIEEAKEREESEYEKAVANMQIRDDEWRKTFIIYHGRSKISYVCSRLLEENPKIDYVLNFNTWQPFGKTAISGKVSARSREGFDVTALKGFDGHKQAAGGAFEKSFIQKIWNRKEYTFGYDEVF